MVAKNSGNTINSGKLIYLTYFYRESVFSSSQIKLKEGKDTKNYNFYGKVPQSLLGKEVSLDQELFGKELFQKLTFKEHHLNACDIVSLKTLDTKLLQDLKISHQKLFK